MKVLLVLGTRPEAVKLAPVHQALSASLTLEPVVCITSQHRELLQPALELFGIGPDIDLDVMAPDQQLGDLTARIVSRLSDVLSETKPMAVVVQGDTTTTFSAALAAFYQNIPVGHVEAGLRTGDYRAPFPEEMNRVLTTRLSRWHFAPTEHNRQTLLDEGVPSACVHVTGNPVIDALQQIRERIESGHCGENSNILTRRFARPFVLVTGHRRESFGAPFRSLCEGLRKLAQRHPEVDLVYPVHLNPQVRKPVEASLSNVHNVHLIDPLDYEAFLSLMLRAKFVITDSGGVQEEAPALGKPVLLMRETTERIEALDNAVLMVGTDAKRIFEAGHRLLTDPAHYETMASAQSPYGDGHAGQRIVSILESALAESEGSLSAGH